MSFSEHKISKKNTKAFYVQIDRATILIHLNYYIDLLVEILVPISK